METFQIALSPSAQALWTSFILSTDLHIPLQDQSNDATQTFPACIFHSQSEMHKNQYIENRNKNNGNYFFLDLIDIKYQIM